MGPSGSGRASHTPTGAHHSSLATPRRRRDRNEIIAHEDDDDETPTADIYDIEDGARRMQTSAIEAESVTIPSQEQALVPTRTAVAAQPMVPETGTKAIDWPKLVISVAQYGLLGYGAYSLYKGKKTKGAVMLGASLALFLSGKYINKIRSAA